MKERTPLTESQKRDAERLRAIFLQRQAEAKSRGDRLTQEDVAVACGWSGQSAFGQFVRGDVALNLKALLSLAKTLDFEPASVSPELASHLDVGASSQAPKPAEKKAPPRSSSDLMRDMLAKHGKGLSEAARERIASVVEEVQGAYSSNVITADFSKSVRIGEGDILIPQYDVRASMGHGQVPAEYSEFIRNVAVSAVEFEKMGLAYESASGLAIITGWGQSMEPTINDKDPLIIDRGVDEFAGDGVYVLTWDGDLYIKRLQKADVPDHLDMISDNKNHKDRVVPVDDVRIHAKVLYIWNGKKA